MPSPVKLSLCYLSFFSQKMAHAFCEIVERWLESEALLDIG